MVSDKDNAPESEVIIDMDKRDIYLGTLDDVINKLHYKASNGRIRDAKNEKVRIDTYRALIYAINTANSIYKDKQIDKLLSEFEKIKMGLFLKESKNESLSDSELNELIDFDNRIKAIKEGGD